MCCVLCPACCALRAVSCVLVLCPPPREHLKKKKRKREERKRERKKRCVFVWGGGARERRRGEREDMPPRRVGIVGFGKVGRFLAESVLGDVRARGLLELAFVCDPVSPSAVRDAEWLPDACKADTVDAALQRRDGADLVVEVAHPHVTRDHGVRILKSADYYVASTTAFADAATERAMLREAARSTGRGIYCSVGALFGATDIQKMDAGGKLTALSVTMHKHPDSFMPVAGSREHLANEDAKQGSDPVELFRGSVRDIASIFPVNVNTMATAALAASGGLGFDGTQAAIVADPRLDTMIIEVEAAGPPKPDGSPGLVIRSVRENPSARGEVTGPATLHSFFSSLLNAARQGGQDGIHLC